KAGRAWRPAHIDRTTGARAEGHLALFHACVRRRDGSGPRGHDGCTGDGEVIDSHALVSPQAQLAADVTVGPFSIIGPDVQIGPRTVVGPHVVINGPTRIGADNRFFQFASIGDAPQDKKYNGEPTRLEIGDRNVFRESCTVNRGTTHDKGVTLIGSDNLFMAYAHVAHDCVVGNNTVFANCAALGGHVEIGDWVIIGGLTAVRQ